MDQFLNSTDSHEVHIDLSVLRKPPWVRRDYVGIAEGAIAKGRTPAAFRIRLLRMLRVKESNRIARRDRTRLVIVFVAVSRLPNGKDLFSHLKLLSIGGLES